MAKCYFCQTKTEPTFKEWQVLERFLSPRKKILRHDKTHLCPRHQRKTAKQIKYARYLALLPYVSYQKMK